jgi:hypothetical protein
MGRLEGVGPPIEVDGGSTAVMKVGHVAGLKAECKPGGTWAECPHWAQADAFSSSK